jgi:hypothetical protein
MTDPSRPTANTSVGDIEGLVEEYLRRSARSIPETPDDVAAAEAWIAAQHIQVPARLLGADPCTGPVPRPAESIIPFPQVPGDVGRSLARAAREGKTITPEVEERMKRDREEKERGQGDK